LRGLALLAAAAGPAAFVCTGPKGVGRAHDAGQSPRDQSAVRVRFFNFEPPGPSPEEIARRKAEEEAKKRSELVRKYAPIAGIILAGGAALLGGKSITLPGAPAVAPGPSKVEQEIKAADRYKDEQAKRRLEYEAKKKADLLKKGEDARALRRAELDRQKKGERGKKAEEQDKKDVVERQKKEAMDAEAKKKADAEGKTKREAEEKKRREEESKRKEEERKKKEAEEKKRRKEEEKKKREEEGGFPTLQLLLAGGGYLYLTGDKKKKQGEPEPATEPAAPAAEAPKALEPEAPKAEAPKAEAAKAEAPKAEEPKVEAAGDEKSSGGVLEKNADGKMRFKTK